MTPEEFIQNPWKDASGHIVYKESFLNMRPAPEYASGEILLASLYRNVGFSENVSESKVPGLGRELAKRLERGRRPGAAHGTGISIDNLKNLLSGPLSSPKQHNQTTRRFLQLCPLVPDAAIYSLSARLSSNSWNPGELVARLIGFGEPNKLRVDQRWRDLFHHLSVGPSDDIWAKFLHKEFASWRTEELRNEWQLPTGPGSWAAIDRWHNGAAAIPATQFIRDLDHSLALKTRLTRRQWISLIESILRLGTAAHIMWICRAGDIISKTIMEVINGGAPLSEVDLRKRLSVGSPFWRYGQTAGNTIKNCARDFVMSRLSINLFLWHYEALSGRKPPQLQADCLSSIPSIAAFLIHLHSIRSRLQLETYKKHLYQAIDDNPRIVDGKEGIGSNINEFLRHVLGQRQTSESGLDTYDQSFFLRKRGDYTKAPWVLSLGPVSVLTLVHCCTHLAKGPRTVEDLCRHLANYGIEVRAQDVAGNDLGQILRNLGLVLDSPDAEGGMVLISPFKTSIHKDSQ